MRDKEGSEGWMNPCRDEKKLRSVFTVVRRAENRACYICDPGYDLRPTTILELQSRFWGQIGSISSALSPTYDYQPFENCSAVSFLGEKPVYGCNSILLSLKGLPEQEPKSANAMNEVIKKNGKKNEKPITNMYLLHHGMILLRS